MFDLLDNITSILDTVRGTVDDLHTSEEEKAEAKAKLARLKGELSLKMAEIQSKITAAEVKAQEKVLLAEAQGESWMQRNWRPLLMLVIVFILFNNYILIPWGQALGAQIPLIDFPGAMWNLLTVGVGGYIGARTYEKVKGVQTEKERREQRVAASEEIDYPIKPRRDVQEPEIPAPDPRARDEITPVKPASPRDLRERNDRRTGW